MLENILDYIRIALYTLLVVLMFLLYQAWEKDHPKTPLSNPSLNEVPATSRFIPETTTSNTQNVTAEKAATPIPSLAPPAKGQLVTVTTDVLKVTIDTQGGDIVAVDLLKYPESLRNKIPFVLLNDNPKTRYIAESGLLSQRGPDTKDGQALYISKANQYSLDSSNLLSVDLTWQKDGVKVIKTFAFVRGSYEIKVSYEINNQSKAVWEGNFYTQLLRTKEQPNNQGGFVNLATYFGAAISTPQKPFEKITFKADLASHENNRWMLLFLVESKH